MIDPALLPSFSRVSRGEDHVSEPANAQLDAASWDGRGGCEADGVVASRMLTPTTPPACAGIPPRAGGDSFCQRLLRKSALPSDLGKRCRYAPTRLLFAAIRSAGRQALFDRVVYPEATSKTGMDRIYMINKIEIQKNPVNPVNPVDCGPA